MAGLASIQEGFSAQCAKHSAEGRLDMGRLRDGLATRWRFARPWLREGEPLWLWLAVAILLLVAAYVFPAPATLPDRVRWSGMLFQFVGLIPVLYGLNKAPQFFDRPPLWKTVGQWLGRARYMLWPPKPIRASGAATAGAAVASGTMEARVTRSGGSLEDRVKRLEADVNRIEEKLPAIEQSIRKLRDETIERIAREQTDRQGSHREIEKKLESVTIGDIHLLFGGVVFLFFGIAFATVPNEIAWVLQRWGL